MALFDLTPERRSKLLEAVFEQLENYYSDTRSLKATPVLDADAIISRVRNHDFSVAMNEIDAASEVIDGLRKYIVHTPHPRYYGLFNPRASFASVVADLISATMNPQLAAWSHSPYASEVENWLIHEFGRLAGFPEKNIDGVFATGGAEANITAVLCALNDKIDGFATAGLVGASSRPLIYCSEEAHHSVIRAARTAGLGSDSVRMVAVDDMIRVKTDGLDNAIKEDIAAGETPIMVIGTAGTTGTGAIDDLHALARIAESYNMWFHVDAAYGGSALLNETTSAWLSGIEKADSVTIDVHKWMSVPMSASMFITSDKTILDRTFRINTAYMPKDASGMDVTDPFSHSIQWSRRFMGLKLYLSLLVYGWQGFSETIMHQVEMGNLLREKLTTSGWEIMNDTPLPVVNFTMPGKKDDPDFAATVCDQIFRSGEAWVSVYPVNGINCIRACITNYATEPEDIEALVATVNRYSGKA